MKIDVAPSTGGAPAMPDRRRHHLRANAPVIGWLLVLLVVTVAHRWLPEQRWLLVHLLLLGAVTNAILVWSAHFTDALLRRRASAASRRWQTARAVALNVGVVATVAGMMTPTWPLVLAGAVVVGAAVAAHGTALALQARRALASRFASTIRYYVAGAWLLPVGAALGAVMANGTSDAWQARLVLAHTAANLLGFVGLTVLGTLVTLWPTMLRTRIDDAGEPASRRALWILLGSVLLVVAGALLGIRAVAVVGLLGYLAGVVLVGRPMMRVARNRAPSAFPTFSVLAGMCWLLAALVALAVIVAASGTWELVSERVPLVMVPLAAGFAAQVLLGAMTYLVPVVLGGGPAVVRATVAALERGGALRVALVNAGLVLCVLPVPSLVLVVSSFAVLIGLASFLPLLFSTIRTARRVRATPVEDRPAPPPAVPHRNRGQAMAGLAVVALAVATAVAIDPAAVGVGGASADDGATDDGAHHDGATDGAGAAADLDFVRDPGADFQAPDAVLPAVGEGTVHEYTFTVSEALREVAPGVMQRLWTFNGTTPGPTLHGRIGDTFVITLVNDGTIGHSIDFHAGSLAPDGPTRTIQPGESLTYRFTATRSGIWMYHCSTMPMSAHIANGMFGAVVIDPPDLPPVDHEYVLVQSELYLGEESGEVDVTKIAAERPDVVAFNGYANAYDHDPLMAEVGQRVRIWVLAAGPNRGTSFHVVGGQFDTVFAEGAYLLTPDNGLGGGSQVLDLGVAQGGFVELAFPEAGHYPFVNHAMVDAERGAHGMFEITGG